MNQLQIIQHNGQRVLTTAQLAEAYGTDLRRISENFNRNKERYRLEKHFFVLEGPAKRDFLVRTQIADGSKNAQQLYLWTEKGAWMHAKSLNTDKAWEAYEMLVDDYYNVKDESKEFHLSSLSPELQLANQLFQAMAKQELKQKELEQRQQEQDVRISLVEQTVEETKEAMEVIQAEGWRKRVNSMINQITLKTFDSDYSKCRNELYEELERRGNYDLPKRLSNYKKRLQQNGATKTAINKANMLDVIEMDDRLREIFTLIVKEAYIKYCG